MSSVHSINATEIGLLSLSSPREWMEHLERLDGTAGCYTVMRVDFTNRLDSRRAYTLWGKEFHLHRLRSSFQQIIHQNVTTKNIVVATAQSDTIILELIQRFLLNTSDSAVDRVQILMLTLLWTPSRTFPATDPIFVSGHICRIDELSHLQLYDPQPIKVALAIPYTLKITNDDERNEGKFIFYSLINLPNRFYNNPRVKISSWCRERRPLEQYFKPSDISEVILVKDYEARTWEILEGLTSNIFVLYNDGTLRSCNHGVLEGYAYSIIRQAAYESNIILSHQPITVQDALDGLWSEVFITSAIRIVIPVKEILIPDYIHLNDAKEMNPVAFSSLWNAYDGKKTEMNIRLWKLLYAKIIESRLPIEYELLETYHS